MNNVIEKHKQMVLRLCKPGPQILSELKPTDCHLLHVGGSVAGEAAELYEDIISGAAKPEKLLEELGDFDFFMVATRDWFGWERDPKNITTEHYQPELHCIELMRGGGHLWDVVKRIAIYRKDPNVPDKKFGGLTLNAMGRTYLRQIEGHYNSILRYYDIKQEAVCEANRMKLDGDKGRYASGSYTNQQAQERRDEQR